MRRGNTTTVARALTKPNLRLASAEIQLRAEVKAVAATLRRRKCARARALRFSQIPNCEVCCRVNVFQYDMGGWIYYVDMGGQSRGRWGGGEDLKHFLCSSGEGQSIFAPVRVWVAY